jgi:beta-glucosidase/6-phospho-beta-glucosidase/beta-galactosidase
VLAEAGSYGLPVYITENGIADADDDQRPGYLVQHLAVLEDAIADGVADVRGYYHWSLVDNFEWSSGYYPKFGLFSFDPVTKHRKMRRSGKIFARIARRNDVVPALRTRYGQ